MEKFSEEEIKLCRTAADAAIKEIARADAPPEAKMGAAMEVGKLIARIIKERVHDWEVFDARARLRRRGR